VVLTVGAVRYVVLFPRVGRSSSAWVDAPAIAHRPARVDCGGDLHGTIPEQRWHPDRALHDHQTTSDQPTSGDRRRAGRAGRPVAIPWAADGQSGCAVSGTPGNKEQNKAVGNFFVQFNGDLCAYHIPGGSFAMRFTGSDFVFVDDGVGGRFLEGTFELTVLEATGIYRPFVGGHNHMVDKLHFLAPGDGSGGIEEYCFCFVSQP
jgi:hypothetical protein